MHGIGHVLTEGSKQAPMEHEVAIQSRAAERYALREMSAVEREEFEAHFFECIVCGEEVKTADLFVENARAELAHARPIRKRSPEPSAEGPGWLAWLRPLLPHPALSAVMLAALVYPWLLVIPGLERRVREAAQPVGVMATVLRAESRGEPARAIVAPGGPLLLVLDVAAGENAPGPGSALIAVIRDEGGAERLRVPARAPQAGEPLHLLIPDPRLSPGKHTLTLHAAVAGRPERELGRYPFTLAPQANTPHN